MARYLQSQTSVRPGVTDEVAGEKLISMQFLCPKQKGRHILEAFSQTQYIA
jgi:hypothetical protein